MAEPGWIKIHRSITEKGWFHHSDYVGLWILLLLKAVYKPTEYLWNGKTIVLKRGQFVTGRNALSRESGLNRSKVDRILKLFESEHQIEQQMTSTSRLISILNYEKYQQVEPPTEPRMSHGRATGEPPVSTKEEGKEGKKEKKDILPHLFRDSSIFDKFKFKEAFDKTDYKDADYAYYYNSALDWSDGKGMKRIDWIAVVRGFMNRDKKEDKYVKAKEKAPSLEAKIGQRDWLAMNT